MLNVTVEDEGSPGRVALVLMHFLGGSGREWDEVVELLGPGYRTVRIDLPGFGGSAAETGYTVAEMADGVLASVQRLGLGRYVLVGHSMSGKVAMVLARRLQDAGAQELEGLVLVAPSPPAPEPMMEEARRGKIALLATKRDGDFERARSYISKNEERDIPKAVEERAAHEVLRMNRTAWVAWLTHGSREDWAERVGVLDLPAMVVAGGKDTALGPEAQLKVTMPHLGQGRMVTVTGCSHLVPMERPVEMAEILREFVAGLAAGGEQPHDNALLREAQGGVTGHPVVPPEYLAFIEGERVSAKTREVLERRMAGPGASGGVLTSKQESTLRAVLARVIPQEGFGAIDLAGYVMARLGSGKGDGWRYDVLPEDVAAYREGLDRLGSQGFDELTGERQDRVLRQLEEEKGSAAARWFEEVRSDAVEAYMAHPATLARLGYSGIGVGGATTTFKGFVTLGPDEREDWEPVAAGELERER